MTERSAERAARNQLRFRDANERIDASRRDLDVDLERIPLLCECEREDCTAVLLVEPDDYEATRSHPRRFLVLHEHRQDSRVVSSHAGFVVIEKDGREGELVEEVTT